VLADTPAMETVRLGAKVSLTQRTLVLGRVMGHYMIAGGGGGESPIVRWWSWGRG